MWARNITVNLRTPRARKALLACLVAAELHDKKETLHITSPKKWFERNRESFICGR